MLSFYKMYPPAHNPIGADKAALGQMPLSAFRYCEPMRTASGYGWYVFPPTDIRLRYDGVEVFFEREGKWERLQVAYLSNFVEFWNANCPAEFKGLVPPYLRALDAPRGVVQVWSGFLVGTEAGWSCNIRGLANLFTTNTFRSYEGIVETDIFSPCPLFTNIQLLSTDVEIRLSKDEPLFQLQPIQRRSYSEVGNRVTFKQGLPCDGSLNESMTLDEWARYRRTFRADVETETHRTGDYAVNARRREKSDPC